MAITFFSLFFLLWKNFKLWKLQQYKELPSTLYQYANILPRWLYHSSVGRCVCAHPLSYSKGAGYVYAPSPHNILVHSIKASMFSYINPRIMIKFRKFNISIVSLPYPQSTSKFPQLPQLWFKAILFHPASNPGSRISLASLILKTFSRNTGQMVYKLLACLMFLRD